MSAAALSCKRPLSMRYLLQCWRLDVPNFFSSCECFQFPWRKTSYSRKTCHFRGLSLQPCWLWRLPWDVCQLLELCPHREWLFEGIPCTLHQMLNSFLVKTEKLARIWRIWIWRDFFFYKQKPIFPSFFFKANRSRTRNSICTKTTNRIILTSSNLFWQLFLRIENNGKITKSRKFQNDLSSYVISILIFFATKLEWSFYPLNKEPGLLLSRDCLERLGVLIFIYRRFWIRKCQ